MCYSLELSKVKGFRRRIGWEKEEVVPYDVDLLSLSEYSTSGAGASTPSGCHRRAP
jgi:hypothetical protein